MSEREQWLHGWPRHGDAVLIGTGTHCAGCGRVTGTFGAVIPEGWEPPGPEPAWPFPESDCPVCALREAGRGEPADPLTARLRALAERRRDRQD